MRQALIFALVVVFTVHARAAQSSGAPAISPSAIATTGKAAVNVPRARRPKPATGGLLYGESAPVQGTDEELSQMVKSFDYLLANEKAPAKRANLYLSQASAALNAAHNMRLRPTPDAQSKAADKNFSELAERNAEAVLNLPQATAEQKFRANFESGLALINLNRAKEAKERFLAAIELKTNAKQVPDMMLFVAETSFDQELYQEALDDYKRFFPRLTNTQKAIAIYKSAWCDFILGDFVAAERNLLSLAGNAKAGSFADDAIKDLAYVMIQHRDEADIIQFTADQLPRSPGTRLEVLTAVYKGFQAQSATVRRPLLFAELMKLESDSGRKLALLISNLHASARRYASAEPFSDFLAIREKLAEWKVTPTSAAFTKNSDALEAEVKALAQSFAETFSGRIQSPEKAPREQVGSELMQILAFHVDSFKKSGDRVASYEIWMDVCASLKDVKCSYEVGRRAMAETDLPKIKPRARIAYIGALEQMQVKNPEAREELVAALTEIANKEFTTKETAEQQKDTLPLVKRLTELLNVRGEFATSIPILQKIDLVEKTSESRFRHVWALYQAGRYADVAAAPMVPANDHFVHDTEALAREAHLRLADASLKDGKFDDYEKHIEGYLAAHPDNDKIALVRSAYLNELCERGKYDKAQQVLLAVPPSERFQTAYENLLSRVIGEWVRTGEFARALALLADRPAKTKLPEAVEIQALEAQFALASHAPSPEDLLRLQHLPKEARHYLLAVLALTQEEAALAYFHSIDLASSPEKELLVLATQVRDQKSDVSLDPKTIKLLGAACPVELRDVEITKAEREAAEIRLPSAKASEKTRIRMVQDDAERTRRLRKRFVKNLEGKTPAVQRRILQTGAELEEKIATAVESSPVPRGLSEADAKAYKSGIADLASEFTTQAGEYKKLLSALDEKAKVDQAAKEAITSLGSDRWPASNSAAAPLVDSFLQKQQYTAALLLLDRWKSLQQVNDDDYYRSREHILLTKQSSDFMKTYVHGELLAAQQTGLMEQWQATGRPVPASATDTAKPGGTADAPTKDEKNENK